MSKILIFVTRCYQYCISPLLPSRCRYLPTCSEYAIIALQTHGLMKACCLTTKRLCRCHPWGGSGFDPVPDSTNNGHTLK